MIEGRPLFDCPDLVLIRQECAAIIGPNGAGKTTFLKTILEQIPPFSGKVRLGASLDIGYFAQAHEGLKAERNVDGRNRQHGAEDASGGCAELPGEVPFHRR